MENNKNIENQEPKKNSQSSGIEIKPKRNVDKKIKKKVIIATVLTFAIIAFGFYWLVVKYFHIGDKNYTESRTGRGIY